MFFQLDKLERLVQLLTSKKTHAYLHALSALGYSKFTRSPQ